MKPGLWEITVKTDAAKQAPQVSPESGALLNKWGMKMPDHGSKGISTKVCYTESALKKDQVPGQESRECKTTSMTRDGDSFSAQFVCNGRNMKGEGTASGTMTSTSFKLTSSFKGTVAGRKTNYSSESNGKYIGSQCGNAMRIGTP